MKTSIGGLHNGDGREISVKSRSCHVCEWVSQVLLKLLCHRVSPATEENLVGLIERTEEKLALHFMYILSLEKPVCCH